MKKCFKCNKLKHYSDFYTQSDTSDGFTNYCKECVKSIRSKYYKENSNQIKKRCNKYYHENQEAYKICNKKSWSDPVKRARNQLRHRTWCKENTKYKKDQDKQYYCKNKLKFYERNIMRRANKLRVKENFTQEQIKLVHKIYKNRCLNCDSNKDLTLDHFNPLSNGYALAFNNVVLLCRSCNSSKKDKSPKLFFSTHKFKKAELLMNKMLELNRKQQNASC